MNTAKWIIGIIAIIVLSYFILLETNILKPTSENAQPNTETTVQVHKRYNDDGSLKADVEMIDGVRNGMAHNYYSDGSVHSEIHYKNDKREGASTWFYEDGKKYRVTLFKNDKKHGIQKKYYRNGSIMAEIPYLMNELQPGTKEFSETGKPIPFTNKFTYSIQNKVKAHNTYLIVVEGKNIEEITKFAAFTFNNGEKINFKGSRDKKSITIHVPPTSAMQNKTITIWLYAKTKMKNSIIIEKQLTL